MEEVNIHYFVPGSEKELESLVGKPVGVRVTSANSPQPMPYSGVFNEEHEFLQQAVDSNYLGEVPLKRIQGWRSLQEHTEFQTSGTQKKRGVKLCSCCRRIERYNPDSKGYAQRLDYLKQNNLWVES